MSTVVNSIPKATRERKYDYDTLFNGKIHRLVQGEDFEVAPESVRGALYGRKTEHNKANPDNPIGLTVQFRTEDGKKVVYVQRTDFKARASKAEKPKKTAKKTGRKPVTPTADQRAAAAEAAE